VNVAIKVKHHKRALITIVDLAGSERLSKTNTNNAIREAKYINKSISALGFKKLYLRELYSGTIQRRKKK